MRRNSGGEGRCTEHPSTYLPTYIYAYLFNIPTYLTTYLGSLPCPDIRGGTCPVVFWEGEGGCGRPPEMNMWRRGLSGSVNSGREDSAAE